MIIAIFSMLFTQQFILKRVIIHSFNDQPQVALIAQTVGHCTSIAEVSDHIMFRSSPSIASIALKKKIIIKGLQ